MKLLHTSDWHLGRVFHNVSLLADQAVILQQIIDYAVEHAVDAVLIAGDIFDRAVPPAGAIALLDNTLHTLTCTHNIPVIMISGNHDSAQRLAFGSRLLANQNLHILHSITQCHEPVILQSPAPSGSESCDQSSDQTGNKPCSTSTSSAKSTTNNTSATKNHRIAFYGIPYHAPEQVRSAFNVEAKTFDAAHTFLVERIKEACTLPANHADFNVLLSHCFAEGATACDSERPLAIGGADRVSTEPMQSFDYVALGHLHGQQKRNHAHIRYSGSPLKYSFSEENHKKSVTLVTLQNGKPASHTQLPLIPPRNMRTLEGELQPLIDAAKNDPNANDFLAITLTDQHALLDAMPKLRAVYPNVLQLEKTFLQKNTHSLQANKALQHNEQAMFADFFKESTGQTMTQPQSDFIDHLLEKIHNEHTGGEA